MYKDSYKILLKFLNKDEALQNNQLYVPGPYWKDKAKKINFALKNQGLLNFRGYYSAVGTSYCDNIIVDLWNEEVSKINNILQWICNKIPFFIRIGSLIKRTQNIIIDMHKQKLQVLENLLKESQHLKKLITMFQLENTTNFGCVDSIKVGSNSYSVHYLELLNTVSFISNKIDFNHIKTMLEIGGGFGANVHIMLQNYKNLKKIIYLDIVPNLVVGTEYLRSFYGDSVRDYLTTKDLNKIEFSNNDNLEIYCVAPWQIEKLNVTIDYFHNAHSFVEMPKETVSNYAYYIEKMLSSNGKICLVSYDAFCLNTTFDPIELSKFFKKPMNRYEYSRFINSDRKNYCFIG